MAHAVSLSFTKSEHMSPPAAVLALVLHALVAFLLWWSTTLHHKDDPLEDAIAVTMEQPPPPPPEPKPEPKAAPEPPKPPPPPPQVAKPAPPPPPVTAFTPFQPAAPLDKKMEGAGKPTDQRPQGKAADKVEDLAPEKSEAPQQALAQPPAPAAPAPTPPAPTPPAPTPAAPAPPAPTLEKELPPVEAPPAPVTSREFPKPAPPAPEPKPLPQAKAPTPAPQPAPQSSLAPSPLSHLPSRGAPPPSARRDTGPPPSPFVNPADVRARNDIQNAYLQRLVYRIEAQRGTDGNPAWLRLRMGVHVVIARDGRLLQVSMAQSSGVPEADRVMLQTFRDASPFPPVPPELPGENFSFTLPFSFVAR